MMIREFTDPPLELDTDRYSFAPFLVQNGPGCGRQEYWMLVLGFSSGKMPHII